MEKDEAILIRKHKLTETSLIVHWCTREGGIVHTAARGARRPRSPFAGKLDLFFGAEIGYARSRKSELHNLREVQVTKPRSGIAADYPRLVVASYLVQLIEIVAEQDTPVEGLHPLLRRALDYLAESPNPSPGTLPRFELRLAQLLGLPVGEAGAADSIGATFGRLPGNRAEAMRAFGGRTGSELKFLEVPKSVANSFPFFRGWGVSFPWIASEIRFENMSAGQTNLIDILQDRVESLYEEGKMDEALRVAKTALDSARRTVANDPSPHGPAGDGLGNPGGSGAALRELCRLRGLVCGGHRTHPEPPRCLRLRSPAWRAGSPFSMTSTRLRTRPFPSTSTRSNSTSPTPRPTLWKRPISTTTSG